MDEEQELDLHLKRQQVVESRAVSEKYRMETEYIRTQIKFYPYVVGSGVVAALIAFLKLVS